MYMHYYQFMHLLGLVRGICYCNGMMFEMWNFQKKTGSTEQLTCYFDEINTSKTCNMTLRKKLSLAEIKSNYPEQYKNSKSHHYHPIYRSDYINVVGGLISTCLIFQTLHKSLLIFVNNVITSTIHICSW